MFGSVVLLRIKSHEINQNGEYTPPAFDDTGDMIFKIEGVDKEELIQKKNKLLEELKNVCDV